MGKLGDLVVRIGADTRDLNKSLGKVQRNMRSMTSNLTKLGTSMTKAITVPLLGIAAMAVKSAADLEKMEVGFISITGGAEQAAAMMKQLTEFTAKTPFQIEAVATAARQLIASGTGIGEVNEQLQFLGDIAATTGQPINEIAAIFAKVNAKGKVELENLNQLAERGIPVFEGLAEATGLLPSELGAGAVTVEQFNDYLKSLSQEGGIANGSMERLSETASGKFSTAMDNLKLAGAQLAESLMPIISKLLDKVVQLAQWFTNLSASTKKNILRVMGLLAVLGPLLIIIPKIVVAFGAFRTGVLALNIAMMANPFVAAAAAIIAVGTAVAGYNALAGDAVTVTTSWKDSLELLTLEQQKEKIEGALAETLNLLGVFQDQVDTQQQAWDANRNKWETRQIKENARLRLNAAKQALKDFKAENADVLKELERVNGEIIQRNAERDAAEAAAAKKKAGRPGSLNALKATVAALTEELFDLDRKTAQFTITKNKLSVAAKKLKKALDEIKDAAKEIVFEPGSLDELQNNVSVLKKKIYSLKVGSDEYLATNILLNAAIKELAEAMETLGEKVPEVTDDILLLSDAMGNVFEIKDTNSLLAFLETFGNAVEETADVVAESVRTMADDMNDSISSGVETMISGVAEMVGAAVGAQQPIEGLGSFLGNTLGDMAVNLGKYAIAHGVAIEAIKKSLKSLNGVTAVAAGIALVALGAGIKGAIAKSAESAGIPLAEGGLVYGPTSAIVGDNKNASIDPEVVAPLSKLKGMLGGNSVQVYGRISGDDIVISNSRASRDRNRF